MRREQIEQCRAFWTIRLHDPKVIENFTGMTARVGGSVEVADLTLDALRYFSKRLENSTALQRSQSSPDRSDGNGVNISTHGRHSQLVRLAHRCSRPHKRVENGNGTEGVRQIERLPQIGI